MTRLPRPVLGAALLVGLTATARSAEPDKLIPAEADTVIVVNVKQLVESEFAKKFVLENLKKDFEKQEAKEFLAEVGLDPLKDVERLVVATIGTKIGAKDGTNSLVVVRGSFDAEKLFRRAEAEVRTNPDKFSKVKEDGVVIFKYQSGEKATPLFTTMIDGKTVVLASDTKYIAAAVKAADAGKAAPLRKELAALIRKADDRASVYIASVTKGIFDALEIPNQAGPIRLEDIGKALPKSETALVTLRVAADVSLDVTVGMKDEESANDMRNALADLIDQAKPLARLAAGFEPGAKALPDMLDAVKVTSKNKDMILTVKLAGADLGSILELQQNRGRKKDRDAKKDPKKD